MLAFAYTRALMCAAVAPPHPTSEVGATLAEPEKGAEATLVEAAKKVGLVSRGANVFRIQKEGAGASDSNARSGVR